MSTEIETIKASQLVELTEVTDSNYIVVTDGATSKKVKATKLKGNSLTTTQTQQLSAAYTHSQTTHVKSTDIPTKISQLKNDSTFVTETYVINAINNAGYQTITDENLTTTNKTIVTAINELNNMIASILDRIENLENQGGTGGGITIPVTGISLSTSTLNLIEGNSSTLTAIISPTNATNQNVVWSTNDSSVATVSNGVVTAVSAGSATITASTVDGNYTANCSITVSASTVVSGSYVTDENGNRLMTENGSYLITE